MSIHPDLTTAQLCELIEHRTGANPSTDESFALATDQECLTCRRIQPSIVVSFDGATFERVCGTCIAYGPR